MSQAPRPKDIPRKQTQHADEKAISKRERCPVFLGHASARNTAADPVQADGLPSAVAS
jgi:hypothetical protein